jgi:hypothetical protein
MQQRSRVHQKPPDELTIAELITDNDVRMSPRAFVEAFESLLTSRPELVGIESRAAHEFDPATRAALMRAGADFRPFPDPDATRPSDRTRAWFLAILAACDTVEETAARLDRDVSRIRQRIRDRSLWSIPTDEGPKIPRIQFDDEGREIPGMAAVVSAVRPDLHPVAMYRWLTTEVPDLAVEADGEVWLSPREWLRSGGPIDPVLEIAPDQLAA